MDDDILLKWSLLTAVIGIFMLFLILQFGEEKVYTVEEAKSMAEDPQANGKLSVKGTIGNVREYDKAIYFDIMEEKLIMQKGVYYKDTDEGDILKDGDHVIIKGQMYEGKIIADEIRMTAID